MPTNRPELSLSDRGTLRDFISRIAQGIYIVTPDGRIVDANPAFLRIFGADSLRQLQRYTSADLVVDAEVLRERRRLLAEHGWIRDFHYDIRCLDGTIRRVRDTVFMQRGDGGRIEALHGILNVVEEAPAAAAGATGTAGHAAAAAGDPGDAEAISSGGEATAGDAQAIPGDGEAIPGDPEVADRGAEIDAPLSSFFTGAPAGFAIIDDDLRFVRINRRLAAIHVLSVEDHLGRPFGEVLPGLAATVEPILRQVLATGVALMNLEVVTEQEHTAKPARVWRFSAFPVGPVQRKPTGIGLVVVDITEAHRREQQAIFDRRYLAALIESCPLAMVTLDPDNCVVAVNAAFERLFLVQRDEVLGRDLDELIADPATLEEARNLTRRTQLGERIRIEARRRRANGTSVPVRVHSSPIVLDDQHLGANVVYEDLSPPE